MTHYINKKVKTNMQYRLDKYEEEALKEKEED